MVKKPLFKESKICKEKIRQIQKPRVPLKCPGPEDFKNGLIYPPTPPGVPSRPLQTEVESDGSDSMLKSDPNLQLSSSSRMNDV